MYRIPFFAYTFTKEYFPERGDTVKLFKIPSAENEPAYMLLKDDIEKTTSELNAAYTNLQNVTDPDLIDYYIYQTKAVQMRYRYLLNCAKKLEDSYTKNPL